MPRPAHRPSQREPILDAARALLRAGQRLSLDSAATAAGVSKPGLMYHFPTKQALFAAVVEHQVDGHLRELDRLLAQEPADARHPRLRAYVRWGLAPERDPADLVMLADPGLRERLTARWSDRLQPWVSLPDDLPERERARLAAARFLAEGVWWTDVTGILPVPDADRPALLATALALIDGVVP